MSDEQLFPTGDEFYPDDEEKVGGPRYESDFAFFKPRADLLLVGKCHAPGGHAQRRCTVQFRVGNKARVLTVTGDRYWERSGLGWEASEPVPFTTIDLRYERSFGGDKSKKNPIGKGRVAVEDDQGNRLHPLPNIENPTDPVTSPKSRPEPSGFGPLRRSWQTRNEKTGTYKGKYLETRWPWLPEDFDWTHFNAAPEDAQPDGYLRGDEPLYFENLHPVHAQYDSGLPQIRVRCFLNRIVASEARETQFEEVLLNLDTLWVDMEAEKLMLVWRGCAEVATEDYEDVHDVFVMSEPLDQTPASEDECYRRFVEAQEESEVATEAPKEPAPQIQPAPIPADEPVPAIDAAQLENRCNAMLAKMGIDPNDLPPEAKEKQARLIKQLSEKTPKRIAETQRLDAETGLREALAELDLDLDNLPQLTAKAKSEQLRFMKELGLAGPTPGSDPEFGALWATAAALMPKLGMNPENLDPLIEQARLRQLGATEPLGDEDDTESESVEAPLTREVVRERAARGESFIGEDLHGLDLSGLELVGIDFSRAMLSGAILTDADLHRAILVGADMTGADLSRANLTAANLAGADLSEAKIERATLNDADLTTGNLTGASLVGAVLTDALFEKATMPGALLDGVEAKDANFSGSDLTGTSFTESMCAGADFSKATMDQAAFKRAQLSEANMEGAVARQISLEGADLTGLRASGGSDFTASILWRANGPESIWDDANLTGCDLRGCRMQNATFASACLTKANLSATDMKFSRFNKANLSGAQLIYMNLFQGSLERADLTDANLSRSNMYGVEFLDAIVERTQLIGANLKMTKLHEK